MVGLYARSVVAHVRGRRLVEVRAGHVVAAGGIGTEELALAFGERRPAVRAHSLGMAFLASLASRTPGGRVEPLAFSRPLGSHEPALPGAAAGEGEGEGVTAEGASLLFKTSPAGVRSASTGVLSGVGGAGGAGSAAWACAPRSFALEPQPATKRVATIKRRAPEYLIPPPSLARADKFCRSLSMIMPEFGVRAWEQIVQVVVRKREGSLGRAGTRFDLSESQRKPAREFRHTGEARAPPFYFPRIATRPSTPRLSAFETWSRTSSLLRGRERAMAPRGARLRA